MNSILTSAFRHATVQQTSLRPVLISIEGANPLSQFSPSVINIQRGQEIIWSNPSTVPDPHTVTFVLDNKSAASLIIPLLVANTTQFKTVTPGENGMPVLNQEHGKPMTILTINSRAIEPTVIGQDGLATKITQKNSAGIYTVLGTEKYISSGWLLPKGLEKGYPGALTSFDATFTKPGVYRYADVFHPWMNGTIIVN